MTTRSLEELAIVVERPDDDSRAAARAALGPHAGVLGDLTTWLAAVQLQAVPTAPRRPHLVVVADELPPRTAGLAADVSVEVAHLPRLGTVGSVDTDDACSREEALAAALAGGLSPDPAHALALGRLDLEPVLDLGLRGDDGTSALLAVQVLRAAVA